MRRCGRSGSGSLLGRRRLIVGRQAGLDAGLEQLQVVGHRAGVAIGAARGVHDAIGLQRNEFSGIVGRRNPDRVATGLKIDSFWSALGVAFVASAVGVVIDVVVGANDDDAYTLRVTQRIAHRSGERIETSAP